MSLVTLYTSHVTPSHLFNHTEHFCPHSFLTSWVHFCRKRIDGDKRDIHKYYFILNIRRIRLDWDKSLGCHKTHITSKIIKFEINDPKYQLSTWGNLVFLNLRQKALDFTKHINNVQNNRVGKNNLKYQLFTRGNIVFLILKQNNRSCSVSLF